MLRRSTASPNSQHHQSHAAQQEISKGFRYRGMRICWGMPNWAAWWTPRILIVGIPTSFSSLTHGAKAIFVTDPVWQVMNLSEDPHSKAPGMFRNYTSRILISLFLTGTLAATAMALELTTSYQAGSTWNTVYAQGFSPSIDVLPDPGHARGTTVYLVGRFDPSDAIGIR